MRIGAHATGLACPAVLAAAVALAPLPDRFPVADLTAKVHVLTGQTGCTSHQAAYDLKKLRGKRLVDQPCRTHRYHIPATANRVITALLSLREKVIAPLVGGVRDDLDHALATCTRIDRDYQALRADLRTLFDDLGITTMPAVA